MIDTFILSLPQREWLLNPPRFTRHGVLFGYAADDPACYGRLI
jgi:hypothetical protein